MNTPKYIVLFFAVHISLAVTQATENPDKGNADLILSNGQIKTSSGWVSAMAVDMGIIVALGDDDSIASLGGVNTQLIDLKGDTVLPGIHDSHVHPLFAGMEHFECGFSAGAGPDEIAKTISACVIEKSPGEWVFGGNWVAAAFKPGQQNRQFLDELAPNNPILLNDEAHHSIWVNSKALELAGITRDTEDPPAGIIERDAVGEATGLLRESAALLVTNTIPAASEALRRKALIYASREMLSHGITAFTVASVRDVDMKPLADLSREGLIKQRIRGCIVWEPGPSPTNNMGESLIRKRAAYTSDRFSPDCVKIFLDGVPTESHTAAMLEPYIDNDGNHAKPGFDSGFLIIPQVQLNRAVTQFDRKGLHIKFHAAGDGAVRSALIAVAKARKENGMGGPFHHIGHSVFVSEQDIPLARDINLSWEFSPYIWYPTPMASNDILKAVGPQRMRRWVPIRDALDTGALVVAGSDWSVVPSVNPWLAMETMVTRQKPGGSVETLGVGQKISLEEAFTIMTHNGARLMGHRDKAGAIEVGMHADIFVTEKNPFTVPIIEVHKTRVKMTFIKGEKVFDASIREK